MRVIPGHRGHSRRQNRLLSVFQTVTTRISATSCNRQAASPLACAEKLSTKSMHLKLVLQDEHSFVPHDSTDGSPAWLCNRTLRLHSLGQQTPGFGARPEPGSSPEPPTSALQPWSISAHGHLWLPTASSADLSVGTNIFILYLCQNMTTTNIIDENTSCEPPERREMLSTHYTNPEMISAAARTPGIK